MSGSKIIKFKRPESNPTDPMAAIKAGLGKAKQEAKRVNEHLDEIVKGRGGNEAFAGFRSLSDFIKYAKTAQKVAPYHDLEALLLADQIYGYDEARLASFRKGALDNSVLADAINTVLEGRSEFDINTEALRIVGSTREEIE